ncbi:uncharacterized protein [Salmo salar]|uniref:Uncharacterized protein n=1 Tax=Salmo salar TaxID=8030 RepID=A0A1S3QEP1_SALSA|nr:uncharacterized protein LOC106591622 [Salmo salar]|eukprot:XP_014038307.1 PREDICTED: uncharacterized protein LOC106591622 [Salmo salar]
MTDSTKKVTKKLAGTAADTAAWVTNIGNEHGQVLVSVLTAGEGDGLLPMVAGLMERYRLAGVAPPQLMYVDRDCCSSFGGSKTAAMYNEWDQLVVRLDIWHLMRRFASGVTTESHQLYGPFMRQLSVCILEWDAGDVRRLLGAKRSELEGKHRMVSLTEAEVSRQIGRKEMALHCRRRTRRAAVTEVLLLDLLETFHGEKGGRHPGHPVAGLHQHPGNLTRAEAPPPLHTGPTRCTVHRDRHIHATLGLSLRTGLHILGVIPPQPVHPRYQGKCNAFPGIPVGWTGEVEQGPCTDSSGGKEQAAPALLQWPPAAHP